MKLPNEAEYANMLGRLQKAMANLAEELEVIANGVKPGLSDRAADNVESRLRNLIKLNIFEIGNDENDPVPADLPILADDFETPDVPS